jgi:hypothetical protein
MPRRLSTRTLVYALVVAFIFLTVAGLAFGLPFGGSSSIEGHLPRL